MMSMNASKEDTSKDDAVSTDSDYEKHQCFRIISKRREFLLFVMVAMGSIVFQSTLSQVPMLPLPTVLGISQKLGEQAWTAVSMPLAIACFVLPSGRLGDLYGYKKLIVIGYAILAFGSLMTGFTAYIWNPIYFNLFRGISGIGISCMFPNTLVLAHIFYPPENPKRVIMLTTFSAVSAFGLFAGLMMSALVAQRSWWPWAFWLSCILSSVLAVAAYFIIPGGVNTYLDKSTVSFDIVSTALYSPSILLILTMVMQGASVGWHHPYTYVLFIVGILFLIGFIIYDLRISKSPLLPKQIYKAETGFVVGCLLLGWSGFGIFLFNSGRFSLVVEGLDIIITAARYVTLAPVGLVSSVTVVLLTSRIPLSGIILIAMTCFFLSNVLFGTIPQGQTYWSQNFVSYLFIQFAIDYSLPSCTILLQSKLPTNLHGTGASIVVSCVLVGVSLGIALGCNVEAYTTRSIPPDIELIKTGVKNQFYLAIATTSSAMILCVSFIIHQMIQNQFKVFRPVVEETEEEV